MTEPSFKAAADHYDRQYFEFSSQSGDIIARLQRFMFDEHVKPSDCVIDFGCGAGFMLRELGVARAIGVEINAIAREVARQNGVEIYSTLDQVPDAVADVVISCHALEHVENPLGELRKMHSKLKPDGKLVIVVPCDAPDLGFTASDRDFHLFSWGASNIGNLTRCANFEVLAAHEVRHRLPPKWLTIYNILGFSAVDLAARVSMVLPFKRRQVRLVARKQSTPQAG
ncbi:MAG: class I SAM-dependent methyltransferase [Methylocystis silviterrae]|uniref:class I SAM-dependent methyltransferase n=1 Tax=Methylocystis silviterrae TaxID=2743612 RepID=UPI003C7922EA